MRIVRRILMATVVVLVFFGLAEVAARATPPPLPTSKATGTTMMMEGSPYLLWEPVPGHHQDRNNVLTINSLGMRDKERGWKTRPRAIAVGDSSVMGFGVQDNEVFTSVLESKLDADFINAAVYGYSTVQALNVLKMRGMALKPDLLIVATLWSDNNFDTFVDSEMIDSYASYEQSSLGRLRGALGYSVLFQWLDWKLRRESLPESKERRVVGWMDSTRTQQGDKRRVPINTYAANLDTFCAMMKDAGGGVLFVMLPNRMDVNNPIPFPTSGPYRKVMTEAAQRHNAPLVSMPDAFRATGLTVDELFVDEMHPSPRGHQIMADAIAKKLTELGWPDQPLLVSAPNAPRPEYKDPFAEHKNFSMGSSSDPSRAPAPPPEGQPGQPGQPQPGQPSPGQPSPGQPQPGPPGTAAPTRPDAAMPPPANNP